MFLRRILVVAGPGLLVSPVVAGATSTATAIRIADRPAYVRVQIDFPRGTIKAHSVEAGPVTATAASVRLAHAKARTARRAGDGLHVAVLRRPGGLRVQVGFAPGWIKYLSYPDISSNGLVLDLWKSAPPAEPSHTCTELTLFHKVYVAASGGQVYVSGQEHGIFENQLRVVVRGPHGAVLGRRLVHGPGDWATHVHYTLARRRTGTVEAVALSPRDGSLECLAQRPVSLPAS